MKRALSILAVSLVVLQAAAREWDGVRPENRIGGRMASDGYLRGKVVLFDRRDYSDPSAAEDLRKLQSIWSAYKSKQFVLIGCHEGTADTNRVRRAIEKLGITYPVYKSVRIIEDRAPAGPDGVQPPPTPVADDNSRVIRVYDATLNRLVYNGKSCSEAQGVAGTAIFAAKRPSRSDNWKMLLDYELKFLPGQAYWRLKSLLEENDDAFVRIKKKFPLDAKRYETLWKTISKNPEIKKLADLVSASQKCKDRDPKDRKMSRLRPSHIDTLISRYSDLKKSSDPFVVQEAKNAIADLMFVKAELKGRP